MGAKSYVAMPNNSKFRLIDSAVDARVGEAAVDRQLRKYPQSFRHLAVVRIPVILLGY
jgi:hypothetical protein